MPADIERPDKILAGLTARQVAILATATVIIWAVFEATRRLVAPPVFAVLAAPAAIAAAALVTGQRDGLTLDRLLIAAWRHARSPPAPPGGPPPPARAASPPNPAPGGARPPRQALLTPREPRRSGPGTARGAGGGLRAAQRTAEAARLLSAADLTVSALDGGQ